MKNREKLMEKIRRYETEIIYATPSRAAKLTGKIVKLKAEIFDWRKLKNPAQTKNALNLKA